MEHSTYWSNQYPGYGSFSVYLLDAAGQDVIIQPDDTVTVQVGGTTVRTMTVADLTAVANAETGEVAGTAPAGSVNVANSWVEVAPDGTYRRISSYATGDVYYLDANHNGTYLAFQTAGLRVREMGYLVDGYVSTPNAVVEVRLLDETGAVSETLSVRSSSSGEIEAEFNTLIQPGYTVEVLVTGQPTIVIPVVALSATPDKATNHITGVGPADSELEVYHRYRSSIITQLALPIGGLGGDEARTVRTDASTGAYNANFAADNLCADVIEGGEYGYVSYTNDEGHIIYRSYRVPLVRVNVSNDTVEIFAAPHVDWTGTHLVGGVVSGTFAAQTNADGHVIAWFNDGQNNIVDIALGDQVQLSDAQGAQHTIDIPSQLSASIDVASNAISGAAPANAELRVRAYHWMDQVAPYRRGQWTSRDMLVQAPSGQYAADFSGYLDMVEYDYTYVFYLLSDNYEISVNTGEQDVSPLIDALNQQLEDEEYQVADYQADTIDYGEERVSYLTVAQPGKTYFGIGWSGGTAFGLMVSPMTNEPGQVTVYEGNGTTSPILIAVPDVEAGTVWRIAVTALDVPHDGFHYVAFTSHYVGDQHVDLEQSSKSVQSAEVPPNEIVTYTIVLSNTGDMEATVVLADPLPVGSVYVQGSGLVNGVSTALYNDVVQVKSIEWEGLVLPNTAVVLSYQAQITATAGTVITNTVTLQDGMGTTHLRSAVVTVIGYDIYLPLVARNYGP